MAIISLSGKAGSGKSLVASLIQRHFLVQKVNNGTYSATAVPDLEHTEGVNWEDSGWTQKSWAYKLREVISSITGLNMHRLLGRDFKDSPMGPEWDNMLGREFMIRIGNGMRDWVHPSIWINSLIKDYTPTKKEGGFSRSIKSAEGIPYDYEYEIEYPNWIITDTRYPNELSTVLSKGGITVNIIRPNNPYSAISGPSEQSLDGYQFTNIIINDGSIEDLYDQIGVLLTTLKLI